MNQVNLNIQNQYFEDNGGSIDEWTVETGNPSTRTARLPSATYPFLGNHSYFPGTKVNTEIYQTIELPDYAKSIELTWWQSSYAGKDQSCAGVAFLDSGLNVIGSESMATMKATTKGTYTERTHSAEVPAGAVYVRVIIRSHRIDGIDSNGPVAGIEAVVDVDPPEEIGKKFTPYGLTAMPSAAERDPNGVYFIRTPQGFKIYTVANNAAKDIVPIDGEDTTYELVSTTKDGLAPQLPDDADKFLDGKGNWTKPAGGGGGGSDTLQDVTDRGKKTDKGIEIFDYPTYLKFNNKDNKDRFGFRYDNDAIDSFHNSKWGLRLENLQKEKTIFWAEKNGHKFDFNYDLYEQGNRVAKVNQLASLATTSHKGLVKTLQNDPDKFLDSKGNWNDPFDRPTALKKATLALSPNDLQNYSSAITLVAGESHKAIVPRFGFVYLTNGGSNYDTNIGDAHFTINGLSALTKVIRIGTNAKAGAIRKAEHGLGGRELYENKDLKLDIDNYSQPSSGDKKIVITVYYYMIYVPTN